MNSAPTLRLLVLNDSHSESERLVSMLNNAGRSTRAQHIESEEALTKLVQEQGWDLIIGLDSTENVPPATAIKQIRRLNKDIPLILLTDEEGSRPIVDGLKLGAVDVVRLDEDQHLLQVIARELINRNHRIDWRLAERRMIETERRNQALLDSSQDAIAFIQDGMFLYTNESFANMLGYEDRDDIECMPIIDIVAEKDQRSVKTFLKDFLVKNADTKVTELSFQAITENGEPKDVQVNVSKANYDEELCIQFVVPKSYLAGGGNHNELTEKLQQIQYQDVTTGLYNKNYLIEKLEIAVDEAVEHERTGALFCIAIHNFMSTVQTKVGVSSADIVLSSVASHASSLVNDGETLCHFSDDVFMLLIPQIEAEAALERANTFSRKLCDHIVDIDGATLQFEFMIGIGLLNETTTKSDTPISHALKALELARAEFVENPDKRAQIYEPEITEEGDAKRSAKEIANLVQKSLDQGRFKLLFQPILSLRGSEREHYEVLLRMVDKQNNGISPLDFLDTADDMGASAKIDRWVILEAIKMLAEHKTNGHDTQLIINLSKASLMDDTLIPWLNVAFKAAKLPAKSVIFQLSENDVNDHLNIAKDFTESMNDIGCGCAISHFGCSMNPYKALQHIKADYIKIDGSFTQELQKGNGEPDSLNKLVAPLHEQNKITIVPFVENASVLSKLWQSGVHYIQGYYLQGPTEQMDYDFDTEG